MHAVSAAFKEDKYLYIPARSHSHTHASAAAALVAFNSLPVAFLP